jgi:hypothetical protein
VLVRFGEGFIESASVLALLSGGCGILAKSGISSAELKRAELAGVGDGWPVDIPALVVDVMSDGGTRKEGHRAGIG